MPDSAAVVAMAGGGGSASLATIVATGNSTPSTIVTGQKDSIGYVYKYFMPTNPLDPTIGDNTPTATVAVDGSKMLIVGGGNNLNNFLDFPLKFGFWNWTLKFKTVIHHKGPVNYGLGVAVVSTGSGTSVMWNFRQTDTAAYVSYSPAVQLPAVTDDNNKSLVDWRWNNYDTIEYTIQRRARSFTAKMKDLATGIESRLHEDDKMFNAIGNLRLYAYSDSIWIVDSFKLKIDEPKNPSLFYITDSWGYGGDASTEGNSHVIKSSSGYSAIYDGGPGEQSPQGIYRLGDMLLAQPYMAFWEMNVNDLNSNGSGPNAALDSACKRQIRFIVTCQANGIIPILSTVGPQVTDGTKYKDSTNAIGARYGVRVIPAFETLKDTTQVYLAAKYVGNSSIHMNDNGHDVYAALERFEIERLGVPKAPTIQWPSIPRSSYFKYELGLNDANQPVAMPARTNPFYMWMNPATINQLTVPQVGSLSATGNYWFTVNPDFRISPVGTSIASSPYFKVDINGVWASILIGGNSDLVVNASSTTFNTNPLDINSYIRPVSIPLLVKANGLAAAKNILSLNSNPSTWSNTDSLFAVHRADTLKFNVDAFGGAHAKWLSGYTGPIDYSLLGNNDWPTRKHVDSLIALAVAGSGGVTSYTDGAGFDGTIAAGALSLKTQVGNNRVLFSKNDFSMAGTDSFLWRNSRIEIPNFSLVNSGLQVGELNLQTALADNSFLGFGVEYASGFKRTHGGQHGFLIYQLAGDLLLQGNSATGSAASVWTNTSQLTFKSTGKFGFNNVTTPNSWAQFAAGSTTVAAASFTSGTDLSSPIAGAWYYDGTRLGFSPSTTIKRVLLSNDVTPANGKLLIGNGTDFTVASPTGTGITFTTGSGTLTIDNDLSTGKSGGQAIIGGTAANNSLLIKGNSATSANTGTTANIVMLTGNSSLTTAQSIDNNGLTQLRFITGTTAIGTITAGTGAGTSPTVSVTGTDLGGYISVTTGTLPTAAAAVVTVNYGNTQPAAPRCVQLTPANAATAALSGVTMVYIDQANITTGAFVITAGATGLTAATAYKWYYTVIN